MNIILPETFTKDAVNIPEDCTQEQWKAIHGTIMLCRHASKEWLKQSRGYADTRWGSEYTGQVEAQLELALGACIEGGKDKGQDGINPADKSTAIVTIQGIGSQFQLWERKMKDEIPRLSAENLTKAIEILEPIERKVREMRALLLAKGQ